MGDLGLIPELGRSSGGGHGNPLQYSCLEKPHGQRGLVGCSPWGHTESDTTEVTKHRETLTYVYWSFIKSIIKDLDEQPAEEVHRVAFGSTSGQKLLYPWSWCVPWHRDAFTNQKLSEFHHLGFLMEVSLRRYGSLNHWSLLIELSLQSLCLP